MKLMQKALMIMLAYITSLHADNIGRYMNIANNIPKMEMKADPQAQAWARSARNILNLTCESIAETLTLANAKAAQNKAPFFCLPAEIALNARLLNDLIQQTYRDISSQESDKESMSVSEVAFLGIQKKYPCSKSTAEINPTSMMHVHADLNPRSE